MRSSKQRSRNKQNRNSRPSGGNVVNRVFDSSGPEGKVRGTPAQIIEKYAQLHRDAQLAGDRVNAENFAQHAEHYTRMLAEAQRDIDRAREEQEQFARDRQAERDRQFEQSRDQGREQTRERDQARDQARDQPRDPNRDQTRDRDSQNRDGQNRDGQARDGQARDGQARDGQGRDREWGRDRERERAARLRAQEEAQTAAPVFGAEASFLSQPLFPVLVADPEDDMEADAGLVETPEERAAATAARGAERERDFARRDRPRRDDRGPEPRDGPSGEARGGERRQSWREEDRPEAGEAGAPDSAPTSVSIPDAPAESQATPGEDGARPGLATAEPPREDKPRRARRPRQPKAEVAEPAPDAAE